MRNHTRVAAAAATVLLLAGCGSSNNPTGTSTAAGGGPSPQGAASDAYRFSACMRTHGVSGFPDPVVHTSANSQSIGIRVTPGLTSSPAFKPASKACRGIMPAGPRNGSSQQSGGLPLKDLLPFVRCLRAHGFQQFPDPNAHGQLSPTQIEASGVDTAAPAFRTAALACVPAAHGALTAAMVEQAVTHLNSPPGGGTSQAPAGSATSANPG